MELWIRSQDKELLVNAKGFELQQHYEDSPCKIFAVWTNNFMCVGTYETKKRALEVLDEIQNIFSLSIKDKSYNEADLFLKAKMLDSCYEMPEE